MDEYDVVVVGGGLGGLSAGAILSKNGYKVHLIEPHDKVGGYATNFTRRKYRMEVAIHVLDGSHPYNLRNEIFEYLEVEKNVAFTKLPEFYCCHCEGESIVVPNHLEQALESLTKRFPKERVGLQQFFKLMMDVCHDVYKMSVRDPYMPPTHPFFEALFPNIRGLSKVSIGHYLERLILDPLLKKTLLANVTFYHHDPYEMNLIQFLISQASYFLGGTYYVTGGSQVFSNYLAKIITDNGGTITLRHRVTQLLVENNVVKSVLYEKANNPDGIKHCSAKIIVANAPMPLVYNKLITPQVDSTILKQLEQFGHSTTATTLFFGLKKSLRQLGNNSYLNIFIEENKNSQNFNPYEHSIGVVDYDMADTKLCPEGFYSCDVLFMDKFFNWSGLPEDEYRTKKRVTADFFIKNMDRYFPGFKNSIDLFELGTPRTIVDYTSNPRGAIYGFSPSCQSFSDRMGFSFFSSKGAMPSIENLHFASAWSYLPGFSGTLIAGAQAAKQIMKKSHL